MGMGIKIDKLILAEMKAKTCTGCHNTKGKECQVFVGGFNNVYDTSFVQGNKCQAYLTEEAEKELNKAMRCKWEVSYTKKCR